MVVVRMARQLGLTDVAMSAIMGDSSGIGAGIPWCQDSRTALTREAAFRQVGRIRARYLTARLSNPPVRPVRETFASYGSRERDIYRKLPFRLLHGIHRGQLARSLATFVPFPHPLPKGLRHVRGFPALRLLYPI